MEIEEQFGFAPYKTAKLIREKGFDEDCLGVFDSGKKVCMDGGFKKNSHYNSVCAPTYQQINRWLKKEYKLFISICPVGISAGDTDGYRFTWDLYALHDFDKSTCDDSPLGFLTEAKAYNAAILAALKLI